MNLTLKEEKYISRKLLLSILKTIIPYIFLVIFFISSVTIQNMGWYEFKSFVIEIFNSFLEMENTNEMIACFVVFGLFAIVFLYGFIIFPIFSILHILKCFFKLKTRTYNAFTTTLKETYRVRKKTNNSSKTTYYGVFFNGQKDIKVKLDFYHFHNLTKGDNILVVAFGKGKKDYFILGRELIDNFTLGGVINGTNNFKY